MKRRPTPGWLAPAVGAVLLLAAAAGAQDSGTPAAAGPDRDRLYLEELRVEREEGWLRGELRRLRTYPHLDRASRLMEEGRLPAARQELETYLELDPRDLEVRYTYLLLLFRMAEHAAVIAQSEALLAARPRFVPALLYRGLTHRARGRPARRP